MRKKIVAGNWKMNKTFQESEELVERIADELDDMDLGLTLVILCPPYVYLEMVTDVAEEGYFEVGAQNLSENEDGAFTGEISATMLKSMEVRYSIIGHSERRKYFCETNDLLKKKVDIALKHEIKPIFCCGEVIDERNAGNHFDVVKKQLDESLFHLTPEQFKEVVIAYEPVWAIGTGLTATPDQAQEMHAFIRKLISTKYSAEIAESTSILYGGSCNGKNAASLFANPDVDGGLIGGASLKVEEFIQIVKAI